MVRIIWAVYIKGYASSIFLKLTAFEGSGLHDLYLLILSGPLLNRYTIFSKKNLINEDFQNIQIDQKLCSVKDTAESNLQITHATLQWAGHRGVGHPMRKEIEILG